MHTDRTGLTEGSELLPWEFWGIWRQRPHLMHSKAGVLPPVSLTGGKSNLQQQPSDFPHPSLPSSSYQYDLLFCGSF